MTTEEITRQRMAACKRLLLAERALKEARTRVAAALDADDPSAFEQALADDSRACADHDAAFVAIDTVEKQMALASA